MWAWNPILDFSSKKFSIHFKNPRKGGQENRLEIFEAYTWNTWHAMMRKNEILTQRSHPFKLGSSLIEKDEILLWPVPSVGDDDIGMGVAIKITDANGS